MRVYTYFQDTLLTLILESMEQVGRVGEGGIFVKQYIACMHRPELSNTISDTAESAFVEINLGNNAKQIIIGEVYRPPKVTPREFIDNFNALITSISNTNTLAYIMGDFNTDL